MGGVEQAAVGAVVQIEGVALAQLDGGQHRGGLRHQGPAGLTPQLGGLMDHHLGEAPVDGVHVLGQRRRGHARIDRGEAAAHIHHVGEHAGADQGAGGLRHGRLEGGRPHALAAHMEGDAHQLVGGPAGGEQQLGRLIGVDPELAGQGIGRALGRDPQAHNEVQVGGLARGVEDLGQLFVRIQREGADPMVEIGRRDRPAVLHRMHEGHARARHELGDQLDLGQARHVEGPHTVRRQGLDDPRRRIGLHSVEDVAFKIFLEPTGR